MDESNKLYCRLCAKILTNEKTVNLYDLGQNIVANLQRINHAILNLNENLPKTVCLPCKTAVKNAVHYIESIETAQCTLRGIFSDVKVETSLMEPTTSAPDIKYDTNEIKYEQEQNCSFSSSNLNLKPAKIFSNPVELVALRYSVSDNESNEDAMDEEPFEWKEEPQEINTKKVQFVEMEVPVANAQDSGLKTNLVLLKPLEIKSNDSASGTRSGNRPVKAEKSEQSNKTENLESDKGKPVLSWKDYTWLCSICENGFPSLKELTSHSIDKHINCSTYKCLNCTKGNFKLKNFISHVKKHHKKLKYYCHFCFRKFKTSALTLEHLKTHLSEFHCIGCNTNFENAEDLHNHKMTVFANRRRADKKKWKEGDPFVCDICNIEFKTRQCLNIHHMGHKNRNNEFVCDQCGVSYLEREKFENHVLGHSKVLPFECKICERSFRSIFSLRKHILQIHEGAHQVSCDKCGKNFRTKFQLNLHVMRMHTENNASLHTCPVCGKGFKLQRYLKRHQIQHEAVKAYSCSICFREFNYWGNYNTHMKSIHGINMARPKIREKIEEPVPTGDSPNVLTDRAQAEEWKKAVMMRRKQKNNSDYNIQHN